MISKNVFDEGIYCAMFNEGFPSPEDNRYCSTLQELKEYIGPDSSYLGDNMYGSSYQCFKWDGDKWVDLPLKEIFEPSDFYSQKEWDHILNH